MIEITGLEKNLHGNMVLRGVNLRIEKGSTCVIIGRSGCGKSVLLKHIVGILKPDKGKIIIDGQDVTLLSEKELNNLRLKIGLVFQGGALFDSLTVGENVGFGLIEHGHFSEHEISKRVEESLSMVGLSGIASLMPADLSGGMKKRVALARSLCMKPEIILYDEPTTGLDPISADSINELIKNLHDRINVTSIVVTHDMKSAYKVGDSIAMLYQGKIIAQGCPKDIEGNNDPVVHQFINGLANGPITANLRLL
ncbi:MAG: ABC transporter ATP-binding protein [Candidatus Omnitrophica bacterium]|nr:ABC transporter ATP-binding protein [Candidatus Omnitrophota bacterium]